MNVPHAYPHPTPPASPERVVWREPSRLASFLGGGEPRTHWLTWSRITATGRGQTRTAKAVTDCGIQVAGAMNDPHGENGMLMPPDTPVTCDGCLEAQGAGAVDAARLLMAEGRAA